MISLSQLDSMQEQLQTMKYQEGPSDAIMQWFTPLLPVWLAIVDGNDEALDDQRIGEFVVGFRESLALRDACIIPVIISSDRWDQTLLMQFATRAHTQYVGKTMGSMLRESFENSEVHPEPLRVKNAVQALTWMAQNVEEPYDVQPLAVAAYFMWWCGMPQALPTALCAASRDESCTLAAIVVAAIERKIFPAHARK